MAMDDSMLRERMETLRPLLSRENAGVMYFGAGCLPGSPSERVADALRSAGASDDIKIASDMAGTALSIYGDKGSGIACILGTGSNTALVRDGSLAGNVPPLGYILGDEGSGASLGRRLVRGVLRRQLPPHVCRAFAEETHYTSSSIMESVYRSANPNRFLASLTFFLAAHIDEEAVRDTVRNEFASFFENQISLYPDYRMHQLGFTGSVAKVFESPLREVADSYGCRIASIASSPMPGLINFYTDR